jgi:type IVB pilus formation R64 PilN family outer membrane protein
MKSSKIFTPVMTLVAASILAGCAPTSLMNKVDSQFEVTKRRVEMISAESPTLGDQAGPMVKGGNARADSLAAAQKVMAVGRRSASPFIGSVMVPATSEDKLPSIFMEPFTLDFSDSAASGTASLGVAMSRLSKLTGVPIRIQPDVYVDATREVGSRPANTQQASAPAPSPFAPPRPNLTNGAGMTAPIATSTIIGDSIAGSRAASLLSVDMRYNGTLAGYLNNVADRLGLAWEYRDNTIVIMRFVTEMHEIFAFPGTQKFSFSSSGSGSGSGGASGASNAASASLSVDESGEVAPLATIKKSVEQMVSDILGSSVIQTDGSGRLMVKTSREMQSRIRDYIKSENNAMRRQAQIQFDIYSVTVDQNDERGINWSLVLDKAGQAAQVKIATPSSLATSLSGTSSLNIIGGAGANQVLGDASVMLQALSSSGFAAQHRPVSLLALNRQWGRISRLSTEYYLSETTPGPASATGIGAPGLKTDKVTTGDQYVAMPQILDDNTILLKFGMSMSDLLGLFDVSVGSGAQQQKVQAPQLTAINAQFPVALRPGEVVAVTGLSRLVAKKNGRRLVEGAPLITGGSDTAEYMREHFIVFIRPVLM